MIAKATCWLALGAVALNAQESDAPRRPDVVIVVADDQTWSDSGCYGNDDVKTPNIDRLAAAGMRFTRAFTATAMCAPTRQQLYTGLFPVCNGAYPNHSKVTSEQGAQFPRAPSSASTRRAASSMAPRAIRFDRSEPQHTS